MGAVLWAGIWRSLGNCFLGTFSSIRKQREVGGQSRAAGQIETAPLPKSALGSDERLARYQTLGVSEASILALGM
jgi:hypothetical protein